MSANRILQRDGARAMCRQIKYVGAYVGDSEVRAPSYKRCPVAMVGNEDGLASNIDPVGFGVAMEDWGKVDGVRYFDSPTGDPISPLTKLKKIAKVRRMTMLTFPVGALTLALEYEPE